MIGMYAHHTGNGHLHRVRAIQKHLGDRAVVFSSVPGADITLPFDTMPAGVSPVDETAGGIFHWAPVGVSGLSRRLGIIAQWIAKHQPTAFYVDSSVEVAVFVRLMGIPVITLAMPGFRHDRPHQVSYMQASAIIAAWPDWVPVPAHLIAHESKLHMVGGISRFEADPAPEAREGVLILRGGGGDNFDKHQLPAGRELSGDALLYEPMPHLQSASVVIATAAQNSIADIAVVGTPAVIFPQQRPFGEQDATAQVLDGAQLAVALREFPTQREWNSLFDQAHQRAGFWHRWQTDGAAARAAAVIEAIADS